MNRRLLGRTGWAVSEIACGTYSTFDVAGEAGRRKVLALMRENLRHGVNLFDTAPSYGHSEEQIGHAVPELAGAGPNGGGPFYVATKVRRPDLAAAKEQIAESFRAVGGRIDLLQVHNMAGWREVLPYLAELKAQGRIGATGVTDYQLPAFPEIEAAMRTGLADVIQIPYNLLQREAEARLLPLARELNLGVLVMTPICPMFRRAELVARLKGFPLAELAPYGVSDPGSLALKYLLSKAPEVILLPATSRPERVASNVAVSGTRPLPGELVARLERQVAG